MQVRVVVTSALSPNCSKICRASFVSTTFRVFKFIKVFRGVRYTKTGQVSQFLLYVEGDRYRDKIFRVSFLGIFFSFCFLL